MPSRTWPSGLTFAGCLILVLAVSTFADATVVSPSGLQNRGSTSAGTHSAARSGAELLRDPERVDAFTEEAHEEDVSPEEGMSADTLKLYDALHGLSEQHKVAFVAPISSRAALNRPSSPAVCTSESRANPSPKDAAAEASMKMGGGGPINLLGFLSMIPRKLPGSMAAALLGFTAGFRGLHSANAGQGLNPLGLSPANAADWPPPKTSQKRVLFLLSDTGGGHKASAKAIKGALDLMYPGKFTCEIEDMWTDHGKWPFNKMVPGYQWLARHKVGNGIWKLLYSSSQIPPNRWASGQIAHAVNGRAFEAYMRAYDPDVVVSVHPLCQDVPLRILDRIGGGKRKVPFITVVTDLGSASTLWFHKAVDKCVVPGDVCEKIALRKGLKPTQIKKHGLPVRQGFWEAGNRRATSADTKAKLGLKQVPTVLVMGGGDGVGPMQAIAQNVGKRLGAMEGEYQMIVVCGKNEVVQKGLKSREWPTNVNVVVNGFVSNMDDWMVAADLMVTKAGPGTIAEASIVGLPCMLSGFLPGQEEGNVPYVINAGYGDFSRDPAKISAKVTEWLGDEAEIRKMSAAASAVGVTHAKATKEIAREIAELVL